MATPRQMTSRTLNALKGWPQMNAVDFHTEFDSSVSANLPVNSGTVVSLNAAGKYVLGVGNNAVMPMFLFANSDDPDIVNDGGDPSTDVGAWVGITPTGQAMALVAVGAYELVSTSNDALTAAASGGDIGKLVAGTMYTNMIVGIVSRGVVDNGYGHNALAFWPCPVFPTP